MSIHFPLEQRKSTCSSRWYRHLISLRWLEFAPVPGRIPLFWVIGLIILSSISSRPFRKMASSRQPARFPTATAARLEHVERYVLLPSTSSTPRSSSQLRLRMAGQTQTSFPSNLGGRFLNPEHLSNQTDLQPNRSRRTSPLWETFDIVASPVEGEC